MSRCPQPHQSQVVNCLVHGLGGLRDFAIRAHCAAWLPATTDLQVTIFLTVLLPRAFKEWAKHPGAFPETAFIQLDRGPDCSSRAMLALWVYLVHLGVFKTIIVSHLPRWHGHTDFDRLGGLMINMICRAMSCGVICVAKFLEYCEQLGGGKDEAVFLDTAIGWNAWVGDRLRKMPGMKQVRQWRIRKVDDDVVVEYRLIMSAPDVDIWHPHVVIRDIDLGAERMNNPGAANVEQPYNHAGGIFKPGQEFGAQPDDASGPSDPAEPWNRQGPGTAATKACQAFHNAAASVIDRLEQVGDHADALPDAVTAALGLATGADRAAMQAVWQSYKDSAPPEDGHLEDSQTDITCPPPCVEGILDTRTEGVADRARQTARAPPTIRLALNPDKTPPALSDDPATLAAQKAAQGASVAADALAASVPIEKDNFHAVLYVLDEETCASVGDDPDRIDVVWIAEIKKPPQDQKDRRTGLFQPQEDNDSFTEIWWWYAKTKRSDSSQREWLSAEDPSEVPAHANAKFASDLARKGSKRGARRPFDSWPTCLIGPRIELLGADANGWRKMAKASRKTFVDVLRRVEDEYELPELTPSIDSDDSMFADP